jgi:hypothetical protein
MDINGMKIVVDITDYDIARLILDYVEERGYDLDETMDHIVDLTRDML